MTFVCYRTGQLFHLYFILKLLKLWSPALLKVNDWWANVLCVKVPDEAEHSSSPDVSTPLMRNAMPDIAMASAAVARVSISQSDDDDLEPSVALPFPDLDLGDGANHVVFGSSGGGATCMHRWPRWSNCCWVDVTLRQPPATPPNITVYFHFCLCWVNWAQNTWLKWQGTWRWLEKCQKIDQKLGNVGGESCQGKLLIYFTFGAAPVFSITLYVCQLYD